MPRDSTARSATATLTRRGTRHASAEHRRSQILEAAARCFSESGYERATMDDVARSSGLSKGSLYRFFSSKDDVLLALFEDFEAGISHILEDENEAGSALGKLRRYGQAAIDILEFQTSSINTWAEFFGHRESRERMSALYRKVRKSLSAIIREGIRSGEICEVSPVDAAAALVAAFEGLLLQSMVDPRFDAQRRWPGVWATLERGLRRKVQ